MAKFGLLCCFVFPGSEDSMFEISHKVFELAHEVCILYNHVKDKCHLLPLPCDFWLVKLWEFRFLLFLFGLGWIIDTMVRF